MTAKTITITEAFAELKTIGKRIDTMRRFVLTNLVRQNHLKDPHEKHGGTEKLLGEKLQGIADLEERQIGLRLAIQRSNQEQQLEIDGRVRSVMGWITWRREVAPAQHRHLLEMQTRINQMRDEAAGKKLAVRGQGDAPQALEDVLVNIDETGLQQEIEHITTVLGTLDGRLSLHNALTTVTIG